MAQSQQCNKSNGNARWESKTGVARRLSAEKAEKKRAARLWAQTAKSDINENLQVRIGEDGVEVSVMNLTDMPDLLQWALSIDDDTHAPVVNHGLHGPVERRQHGFSGGVFLPDKRLSPPLQNAPKVTPTRCLHPRSLRLSYPTVQSPADTENSTTSVNTVTA